jgi:transcriptional regulator with XRE-family HTH domain
MVEKMNSSGRSSRKHPGSSPEENAVLKPRSKRGRPQGRNVDFREGEEGNNALPTGLDPVTAALCNQVRQQRQKLGWTLEKMSAVCGVSRSMLSEIERGQSNPTLAVAYRIARALGISLGDLVAGPETGSSIDVILATDKTYHFRSDNLCTIRTLSPLRLEKDVEFYELTLRPGAALRSAPHYAGTREFLTVESGALRITSGKDQVNLGQGDSAHYPADVEHVIENLGENDAIAFLVVTYGRA